MKKKQLSIWNCSRHVLELKATHISTVAKKLREYSYNLHCLRHSCILFSVVTPVGIHASQQKWSSLVVGVQWVGQPFQWGLGTVGVELSCSSYAGVLVQWSFFTFSIPLFVLPHGMRWFPGMSQRQCSLKCRQQLPGSPLPPSPGRRPEQGR